MSRKIVSDRFTGRDEHWAGRSVAVSREYDCEGCGNRWETSKSQRRRRLSGRKNLMPCYGLDLEFAPTRRPPLSDFAVRPTLFFDEA